MSKVDDYIAQDRARAVQRGDQLFTTAEDRANQDRQRRAYYEGWGNDIYSPLVAGQGGYSPEEAARIRDEEGLSSAGTSDQEFDSNQLTPDERNKIAGNPWARAAYFDPDSMNARQGESGQRQRGAVNDLSRGEYEGITPDLNVSDEYGRDIDTTLSGTATRTRGGIDPGRLRADPAMLAKMQVSPEEEQQIITNAGISSGQGYRAAVGDLERNARAAGADPLGVAAARLRYEGKAGAEAGDSEALARVKAAEARRAGAVTSEGVRMGGENTLTGYTTGTEMALGTQALQAQQAKENTRLGAAQDVSNRRIGVAADVNKARIGSEEAINAQERQQNQFNANLGTTMATGIEQDQAARDAGIAQNRQQTNQENQTARFGQRFQTSNARVGREGAIADERLQQAKEGRQFVTGQQHLANANEQAGYGQEQAAYGAEGTQAADATAAAVKKDAQPKWWEKVIGGAIGAGSALMGAGGIRGGGVKK